MSYSFYCLQDGQTDDGDTPAGQYSVEARYTVCLWRPTFTELVPARTPLLPFGAWWLFHQLNVFRNRDYGVLVIYNNSVLVHHSGIFPRYFRFPFMAEGDLQIGDTWTAPDHCGQGLATYAIHRIVQLCKMPGRRFWYIVEQDNMPSIRVIEKTGFTKVGEGTRTKRFGLGFLGAYVIQRHF